MKDEIKEILDYLKNNTFIPDETKRKYKILHRDEVYKLLDYITKLQEENQKLNKEKNVLLENLCMARQKYNNDKARYRRRAKLYKEELDKVKSRNENAIELVKSLIVFWKKYSPDNTMEIGQFENVLGVLQGEDKDE